MGRASNVWKQDDVPERQQSRGDDRLFLEDIESCAGDPAGFERFDESLLIDDWPPCRIDQKGAGLHPAQHIAINQVARSRGERNVNRNNIRRFDQIVKWNVTGDLTIVMRTLIEWNIDRLA